MKKYITVLGIAVAHFVVTKVVTRITFSVVTANAEEIRMSFTGHLLMIISKVLYFPVMSLAWYPRRFFPGNFILIPLFINSLVWAVVLYLIFLAIKRWRTAIK